MQVRDYLTAMGFNLTQYRANPLASIGTTLRRMVPGQLDSETSSEGLVLYRRGLTLLDQMARANLEKLESQRDKLLREGEQILRTTPKGSAKKAE